MKKIIFILFFILTFSHTYANTYIQTTVDWHLMKVIEYDKSSALYDIKVLKTETWSEQELWKLLLKNNAITWVNWVFFCPSDYSYCKDRPWTTNNERYVSWEKFAVQPTTWDRVVFAWDKNKNTFLFQTDSINMDDEWKIYDWVSNRPLLLQDWVEVTEKYWDLWLIDNKMKVNSTRNFICSNKENTKITFWFVYDTDIDYLAAILKDYWCYNALNLDAWLSTAMVYNWRYLAWPQRNIIDAIAIVPNFDVAEVDQKAKLISQKILENINKKKPLKQLASLDNYISAINQFRVSFYDKYSSDVLIYDEEWNSYKNGYKIDVNTIDWLQRVYLINQTVNYLKDVRWDYLNRYNDELAKQKNNVAKK